MKLTEDILMAYADGEGSTEMRALIRAEAAKDPALAARIEAHQALRTKLTGAYAGALEEPVPLRLVAAARGGPAEVVELSKVRARNAPAPTPKAGWGRWAAMAACLAAGVMVGLQAPRPGTIDAKLSAQGALAAALDHRLAADPANGRAVRVGISFRDGQGAYCRTFQTRDLAGLACREADDWKVRMGMAQKGLESDYRTASALPPPVMAAVEAMIAGAPLDAAGEAAAKARGWKAPR